VEKQWDRACWYSSWSESGGTAVGVALVRQGGRVGLVEQRCSGSGEEGMWCWTCRTYGVYH
jgi:hypothetical protein